ncbi:MAG TPA: DoxX family protein [Pseudonocardiaceae bacterium]|jgi:uncharacterized membrane protein YphA (DoxX/SURF4 family)|nr:DoxX family protein [Pseudonocardiaceae bacterium]
MIVRRVARLLLASVFVYGGVDTLRNPGPRVKMAAPFVDKTVERFKDQLPEQVPTDPATLVRLDAAIKVVAGLALAFGRFPRLAALALAGSMVPTTLAGHSFWEHEDPAVRGAQQTHFLKNVSLLGGLLLAVADRGKKDRSKRAAKDARKKPANKPAKKAVSKPAKAG